MNLFSLTDFDKDNLSFFFYQMADIIENLTTDESITTHTNGFESKSEPISTGKSSFHSTTKIRRQWWKESIAYQIYPKSFQDSNGDGIGDIRGRFSLII
jgi:hypothetical protein